MARKKPYKYNQKKVDKICELFATDTYTITEVCNIVDITRVTYYDWLDKYPEFEEAVERAHDERMEAMTVVAERSLMKKIQGYDVKESKLVTVAGKKKDANGKPIPIVKEKVTYTKHVAADTASVIFSLTNGNPRRWKNKQHNEVTGKDGKDLFAGKSDEELDQEIQELQTKLGDEQT